MKVPAGLLIWSAISRLSNAESYAVMLLTPTVQFPDPLAFRKSQRVTRSKEKYKTKLMTYTIAVVIQVRIAYVLSRVLNCTSGHDCEK